jgi:hypothetical protein
MATIPDSAHGPTRTELAAAPEIIRAYSKAVAFGTDVNPGRRRYNKWQMVQAALAVVKGALRALPGSPTDLHTPASSRGSKLLVESGTSPPATPCSGLAVIQFASFGTEDCRRFGTRKEGSLSCPDARAGRSAHRRPPTDVSQSGAAIRLCSHLCRRGV